MKKLVILLLVTVTAGCNIMNNFDSAENHNSEIDSRIAIDKNWDKYENLNIGFAMKIPKEAVVRTSPDSANIVLSNTEYGWEIKTTPTTRLGIPTLIKKIFGKDCYLKETSPWYDNLEQLVVTLPDTFKFGEGDCKPRGSAWAILFSESQGRLVFWELGQEDRFNGLSGEMISSFKLVEQSQ